MILSWRTDIRRRGTLRVAELASMRKAPWRGQVAKAIKAFNTLSAAHALGVTLVAADDGADIIVGTVSGYRLHGHAQLHSEVPPGRPDSEGRVFRCDIQVADDPKTSAPGVGLRRVGNGVMLAMLVHELVHACGLDNAEHSRSGDLFVGNPQVIKGDTAAGDKMDSGRTDGAGNPIGMPPLLLNDDTIAKIQQAWGGATASRWQPSIGGTRVAVADRRPSGFGAGGPTGGGTRPPGPLGISMSTVPARRVTA
ncbi:MAG: hypothetical protein AB7G13_24780 [Lautropia sp.]